MLSLSVLVSVVWTTDQKKYCNLSKKEKNIKLPVIWIVCIGISKIVIYLTIIYSSVGTSKTQHVSHLISMHWSLTKCNYVNLFRNNCPLYSDTAFGECSLSKWRDRGCTLHRQRQLASFWATRTTHVTKKVTFPQQTMSKKKDEREGEKMARWKAQCLNKRSNWSRF